MSFEELFNGEKHYLEPRRDWHPPFLRVLEVVPVDGTDKDPLEGPDFNLVLVDDKISDALFSGEEGWSAVSLMLQAIARLVAQPGEKIEVFQQIAHAKDNAITGKWHTVQWKGEEVPNL